MEWETRYNWWDREHGLRGMGLLSEKTLITEARSGSGGESKPDLSEARFRDRFEAVPAANVAVDHEGTIPLVDAVAEKLFGYHREELLGQLLE